MPGDLHIDMEELGRELKHLGKAANGIKRELRKAVAEAGAEVISAIRAEASWSTRIPGATTLAPSFGARAVGVKIKVNSKKAPHARPLEMGTKDTFDEGSVQRRLANGSAKNRREAMKHMRRSEALGRTLRHPVFHKTGEPGGFADMPLRPFFFAAAEAMTPRIEKKIQAAIDQVAIEAGFKGR